MTTVKLHVLRHGQATHNLLAETQQGGADDVFDPELTDLGKQQATQAGLPPNGLQGGVQFWISPLKRCLQTGCLALPKTDFWHVYEDIREIAGEKLCDARMTKQDLIAWTSAQFPHVRKWDFDGVCTEEDELVKRPRESAGEMAERVRRALKVMFDLATQRQIYQFVWVSHSAFLSMLFAVLNVLPVERRWLNNGQWQSLTLEISTTMDAVETRLNKCLNPPPPSPVVGVSADTPAYTLTEVEWRLLDTLDDFVKTSKHAPRVTVSTFNGSLTQLFKVTEPRVPAVAVAQFPLAPKGADVPTNNDLNDGLTQWQTKMDLAFKPSVQPFTPPYVFNASKALRAMPGSNKVGFERMGLTAFSDCVLLGFVSAGLVADDVLRSAIETSLYLLEKGSMFSVNVIFCEQQSNI